MPAHRDRKYNEPRLTCTTKARFNQINKPAWKKFNIKNTKGFNLSALLCDTDSDQVVIVCHGFTGSKEGGGRAVEMGEALVNNGFSTILFDFSGCGESDGCFADISLSSHTDDLEAVVKWSRQNGFKKIVLNGRSFGGSTVINYASRDKNIKAVCTWAAAARLVDLFESFAGEEITGFPDRLIAIHEDEGTIYLKANFFYDLLQHDMLKAAAKLDLQGLLIIHGSADEAVPVEDAHLLYQAASEPKQLSIIEESDHRFSEHINEVWDIFFNWLRRIK